MGFYEGHEISVILKDLTLVGSGVWSLGGWGLGLRPFGAL